MKGEKGREQRKKYIKSFDLGGFGQQHTCGYQGVKSGAAYIAIADTLPLSAYICRRHSC